MIELIKVLIFGIIEGITEWLPISSTGHLILLENLIHLNQPEDFWNVFKIVIQLGAILAVVVIYWDKLWPFSSTKNAQARIQTWNLWFRIVVACLPAIVIALPIDNYVDAHLSIPNVIAAMLIIYGVLFIILESRNRNVRFPINKMQKLDMKTALFIGLFQCLAIIPGTSRSGATILGAMLLGCSRSVAAEFSFFLGIPSMFGYSLVKILKHGFDFTGYQVFILLFAMFVAFVTSIWAIKFLLKYVRKHDFTLFGIYRIVLGVVVFAYFGFIAR